MINTAVPEGGDGGERNGPLLLPALGYLVVDFFPYSIGLLVVLFVDATGKQADFIVGVLVSRGIVVAPIVIVGLGPSQLCLSFCDLGLDLVFCWPLACWSEI